MVASEGSEDRRLPRVNEHFEPLLRHSRRCMDRVLVPIEKSPVSGELVSRRDLVITSPKKSFPCGCQVNQDLDVIEVVVG